MSVLGVFVQVLAAPPVPTSPSVKHVTIPFGTWIVNAGILFVISVVLGFAGEWIQKRSKFGLLVKGLSLLTIAGAVSIINVNLFNGFIAKAGSVGSSALVAEASRHGLNATAAGIALLVAVLAGVYYIFISGALGLIAGPLFAVGILVATQGSNFQWLNQILTGWYNVLTHIAL